MYLSEVYGQGRIYAKCVAASTCNGVPIYTIETRAPKFIDAEFEKHRMLSSNSSSSRAIPFKHIEDRYLPFDIRKQQKGMQGYESLEEGDANIFRENVDGLYYEIYHELNLWRAGLISVHKQHLNRYIEPWMFQKKVVTATEWDNFFNLRLHPNAQPEMQELARCMKEAIDSVAPTPLSPDEWHLPYVTSNEYNGSKEPSTRDAIKYSVARCARVSYLNHDKSDPSIEKDLALANKLLEDGHMTPFEHQATPMDDLYTDLDIDWQPGVTHQDRLNQQWSANFRGWIQYRQIL